MNSVFHKLRWNLFNMEEKPFSSWKDTVEALEKLPAKTHFKIKKSILQKAPPWPRSRLGMPKSCLAQYRSTEDRMCIHLREYKDHYTIHIDAYNPKNHMLKHWIFDSPEYLVMNTAIVGLVVYAAVVLQNFVPFF